MGDPNTGEIYHDVLRDSEHVGLTAEKADELKMLDVEARIVEMQQLVAAREAGKPDLRTKEGAKHFLDYHAPNADTLPRHGLVNMAFQELIDQLWDVLPDGPGKTVTIRAIGRARMECNSCIANGGQ